jgi:hypothetical protein
MKDHLYPEEYKHYQMERLLAKSKGGNPSIHDAAKKIKKRKQAVKNQLKQIGGKKKKK